MKPNAQLPEPLEPEYPAGWWLIYVIAVLVSIVASAVWPYWVTP